METGKAIFYDDECRICYVWRAKQFMDGLQEEDISFTYSFYAYNYVCVEYQSNGLTNKQQRKLEKLEQKYANEEDYDESEEGPDIEEFLMDMYFADKISPRD
jgi:hypothetical protein